jgi:hypothetical protein
LRAPGAALLSRLGFLAERGARELHLFLFEGRRCGQEQAC